MQLADRFGVRIERSAVVSDDGRYRFELKRWWDEGKPRLNVVLLNPSTADALADDATVRWLTGFVYRSGFGGFVLTNLYAYRATKPSELVRAQAPHGAGNDHFLHRGLLMCARAGWVLVGWGDSGAKIPGHAAHVASFAELAAELRLELRALGTTKAGAPWHPLRKSQSLVPRRWEPST